jgi:hypothetical protein
MEVGEEASEEKVESSGLVIFKYMRIREYRNEGKEGRKGIVMLLSSNEGIGRGKRDDRGIENNNNIVIFSLFSLCLLDLY